MRFLGSDTPRGLRIAVFVVLALTLAVGCEASSAPGRISTPDTAAGLVEARTTFERALERADAKTIRAFYAEKGCTAGKLGRQLEALLAMLKPTPRSTIRVSTRNMSRSSGEVKVRTHYSLPGESGSTTGDWEPWIYQAGGWRISCMGKALPT